MRDIDDRVAELQIDPVYPHLLEILDTSPAAARPCGSWPRETPASRAASRWPLGFVLLAWPAAWREYLGTDVLGNISPAVAAGRRAR